MKPKGFSAKLAPKLAIAAALATMGFATPTPAQNIAAQAQQATTPPRTGANDLRYAAALHLAYVVTPSAAQNAISKNGLEALAGELINRTSVEPGGVVGINVERDELSLFPFIYWPVTAGAQPLSPAARERVQSYLNHGGLIVFDGRDQRAMQNVVGSLTLRPLVEMGKDDTLTKTFYLMSALPGTDQSGKVMIEARGTNSASNVSSVVIGSRNWAAAWGAMTVGRGSDAHEQSLRAGINMVMLALTGTYKDDQIHAKNIMEKLGKPKP